MAKPHPHQQLWPSIFSGCQVIVNRVTPPHRDAGGCPTHYDLLMSAGTHTKASLVFQNWGFICLIGLEMLWQWVERCCIHQVGDWSGERGSACPTTCQDKVHERLGVVRPIGLGRGTTCLLLEIDLEIQPENDLFIFQGYINGRPKGRCDVSDRKSHDQVSLS